ncbi:MAG: metal-dependent transcriptional regulator [Eubacteriales bacterium]|nr:metal-dependent transcriptional regulator [Eubacteriales bacterium]
MVIRESAEDYVEAVLIIEKQKGSVHSIDIARHLKVSKPSVSYAIKNLSEAGFLYMDEDNEKQIKLTPKGRSLAEQMYERHVFFTQWLKSLGIDAATAASEACRMEHVLSKQSFQSIKKFVLDHKK